MIKQEMFPLTDKIDFLREILKEYEEAERYKKLTRELLEQVVGDAYWLLKYSEKYSIPLPHQEQISAILEKEHHIVQKITEHNSKSKSRIFSQQSTNLEENKISNRITEIPIIKVKPRRLTARKIMSKLRQVTRS